MRTRRNLVLLLFVVFLLTVNNSPHILSNISTTNAIPTQGSRGSLKVNGTGSGDHTTIQAAIDNATSGDTIFVDPGIYNETITISKPLQLVGSGSDVTVIEGEGATNVVFINASWVNVRGFKINDSGWGLGFSSLYISDSDYCKVENNLFTNCRIGIRSAYSEGNVISNNTFLLIGSNGIYLDNSNYTSIFNNTCESRGAAGAYLYESHWNTIRDNIYDNNYKGIDLDRSRSNRVYNNTCNRNGDSGIHISRSDINSIFNNTFNDNWRGIYLYSSDFNEIFSNTAESNSGDGMRLSNSDYNKIFSNTIDSNSRDGMQLSNSDYNEILSNSAESNSGDGMQLSNSDYNSLMNNSFESNDEDGLYISGSNLNNITGNIGQNNDYIGIEIYYSYSNNIFDNIFDSNYYHGISLYRSDLNLLNNNSCNMNRYYGLYIERSDKNTIVKTSIKSNSRNGIYLDEGNSNKIFNNTFDSNHNNGIFLYYSNDNEIFNNSCDSNVQHGLYFNNSHYNEIYNNTFNNNENRGISISWSDWNSIENNTSDLNSLEGIYLDKSNNNNISKNNCSFNKDDGIKISNSKHNNVRNNSINSNDAGIELYNSSSNKLTENTCLNTSSGISLYLSDDNIIFGIESKNNVFGIRLYDADNNQLFDSVFSMNERDGIYIEESNNNDLLNNICFSNNGNGTTLIQSSNNRIYNGQYRDNYNGIVISGGQKNEISNNFINNGRGVGISLFDSKNTIIEYNYISENSEAGIYLQNSINNTIHHNDLIHSHLLVTLAYDDGWNNSWNDGNEGNYWSNYLYRYYGAEKYGKVWSSPYEIEGNSSQDNFSLRFPVDRYLEIPLAYAGPDVTIDQFDTFTFNSTLSFDHVGIKNFSWSFRYNGKDVEKFGPFPTFDFDIIGVYEVRLSITNTRESEDNDTVFITVLDREPPWINVEENVTIDQHESAFFDAGNCSDNLGIMNVTWIVEYLGETYFLYGMRTNFTFPEAGLFPVTIRLNDSWNNTNQSMFYVKVLDITLPIPKGGSDQTVDQYEKFYLDGSLSTDNVGIAFYTWTFFYNEKNWIYVGSQMDFTFYRMGEYIIFLNVSDDAGNYAMDHVIITVSDVEAPLADPGGNLTSKIGNIMKFNGSESTDNVGIFNYSWSFPYLGAQMVLYGPTPVFIFRDPGTYQVKLTVTDKAGNSNFDSIFVFVEIGDEVIEISGPDENEDEVKPNKDNISFYICSVVIIATIFIVVILNSLYKRKKLRKQKGSVEPEEEEFSGMIDDISDSFFKKREDEEYDYRLPRVVLKKKEPKPKKIPRIEEVEKKKIMIKVIRKNKREKEMNEPEADEEEVMEVKPLPFSEWDDELDEPNVLEAMIEDKEMTDTERSREDTDSVIKDENHKMGKEEKTDDETDSMIPEERQEMGEKEMGEKEKSIEEIMNSLIAEIEYLEEPDEFKSGFLQGYERALEELRSD